MKLKMCFTVGISLIAFLLFFQNHASAQDITEASKTVVVDNNTKVSSKYSFVAQFNKKKTQVSTFGIPTIETTSNTGITKYYSFNPQNDASLKGKFGIKYTNVGRYGDKEVDLKITILDWEQYTNQSGKISFGQNNIWENNQGYNYVDQKWEFFEHGTDKLIKINGFMTINDIDGMQCMWLSKETSSLVEGILIDSSAKGWLHYSDSDGEIKISEENGFISESTDPKAMFTMLIGETDTLRFKWAKDFERYGTNKNHQFKPEFADGEFFGYLAKKPAQTEMLIPIKKVEVTNKELDNATVSVDKSFKYNLYHQIPDEWKEFYYDSYEIKDTIDDRLNVESLKVTNEEGTDVSNYFTNKSNKNQVNLVAKSESLKKASFYNHVYKVEIDVRVKNDDRLVESVQNGKVEFKNVFTVSQEDDSKSSNEVISTLHQRNVNVWHLDKVVGTTLEHRMDKKFDGEEYSYSTKDTFKKGNYIYVPTPKEVKKGIVTSDIDLKFYYQLPFLSVNMKHIQIFTASSKEGLPVKLDIVREFPYGIERPELLSKTIRIELFEKGSNKALISQAFLIKDVPEHLEWKVPKIGLIKDTHKNYVVQISGIDNVGVVSSYPKIDTEGYTSSEKNLRITADNGVSLGYEGVIMTEREAGEDMKVFRETLAIPLKVLIPQKTGYGFDLETEVIYTNELATSYDIQMKSIVDKKLIDSNLDYKHQDEKAIIPLEQTKVTKSTDKKRTSFTFEFPHVNVEQKTGALFNDQQVANKDSRIKYAIKDGGRKFYVPIWADLGEYNILQKSVLPIGVNRVNVEITRPLNLFAYMYGTIGSQTLEDDELLLEPVDPESPFPNGQPPNWTDKDIEWLKG
ncbi:hypothetical protein IGW_05273 [Bacillus cereus ISP3191]|uniref:isopeptide-forming domain-containing fimbrial protein n=1 Tax=Bacillus cereus TaxID=1396 RepID=UPI0002794DB2|nr:isopeptide-forming domain-containing fimbrial protein [Bacillus cereus]EJQ86881.1 hypothetical protein IGW_05273 [Bacillus cereus ISP3191]MDR4319692.1 isopeptide-forming domain-containing fimbrial protein [Bacillus paranthracis]